MPSCQICNYNSENIASYNRHLKTQTHINNINNSFIVSFFHNNLLVNNLDPLTKKNLIELILDPDIFLNRDYNQIKINYRDSSLFYITKDIPLVTKIETTVSNNQTINNQAINNYLRIIFNLVDSVNFSPIMNQGKDYLKFKILNFKQEESFSQGFMLTGSIYIFYLLFSSLFWIILFSTLGGLSLKYLRTNLIK